MKHFFSISLIFISIIFLGFNFPSSIDENIKLNQIQVLGSHNSYRLRSYAPLFNYWNSWKHPILKLAMVKSLDYSNDEPLEEQLSTHHLRALEIDVYYDPQGGRYYNRLGNKLINETTESGIEELKKPGFKVMHVPDFDYMTHHYTFIDALKAIKNWSDKNPKHIPLFIMIDVKEKNMVKLIKKKYCTTPLLWNKNAADSIDAEIEAVFGKNSSQLLTPDDVRGNYATLNEAVLNNAWPTLADARGKIIFIMSASSNARELYLEEHYSLKGRKMFCYSYPGNPECAFIKMDDVTENFKEAQALVKQGYMVRTRSDSQTKEARKGNYKRYNKALESGAQIISTDYYVPDERHTKSKKWTDFKIQLPDNNVARVNPTNCEFGSSGNNYLKQ